MRMTSRNRSRRGAAIIEMALIFMIFLVFLLGIMDWSWVFFQHQTILWNTTKAARWASTRQVNQAQIQNMVLCGTPSCSGSYTGLFQGATITAQRVGVQDTVEPHLPTIVTRYHIVVSVSNYTIWHFTPFFASSFTGRPIVVSQPMECQYTNCACLDGPTVCGT